MPVRTTYFSKKVTLLNVIATFLVVVLHSETPLRFGQELSLQSYPFIYCVFNFAKIAVPLFFFISAILFYRNCELSDLPRKLYKRLFSLVIPYLLWNLIFCIIYFTLSRIPYAASRMSSPVPLDSIKGWVIAIVESKLTPLWFIQFLIIYCLASPAVLLIIRNRWVGLAAVACSLIACILLKWEYFNPLFWTPVYLAGAWAGRHIYGNGKFEDSPVSDSNSIMLALSILAIAALLALAVSGIIPDTFFRFFAPVIMWFGTDFLRADLIRDRFEVKEWMGYSFFIFATHYFVINVMQTLVRSSLPGTPLVLNLTFIISPVITMVTLIWTARLISKYKFYKVISGGR